MTNPAPNVLSSTLDGGISHDALVTRLTLSWATDMCQAAPLCWVEIRSTTSLQDEATVGGEQPALTSISTSRTST